MSYARIVNTEWRTKLTTTDVTSASANLTVSESFVCKPYGVSLSVNLMVRVSASANLMVRVCLSEKRVCLCNLRVRVCLSANLVVSVSLSGNPGMNVSVSVSLRDTIYFSFLFDSVPSCQMPGLQTWSGIQN